MLWRHARRKQMTGGDPQKRFDHHASGTNANELLTVPYQEHDTRPKKVELLLEAKRPEVSQVEHESCDPPTDQLAKCHASHRRIGSPHANDVRKVTQGQRPCHPGPVPLPVKHWV